MLAGGGVKVGFQAGVLQVWLDEANVRFDHADGASGGCLNLAMYCEGRSGTQIADAWRDSEPLAGVDLDLGDLLHARSLFSMDRYRRNVLQGAWKLDWQKIRTSPRLGTFNLCNFSRQRLEVVENARMDEDRLVSAISLPMWFPPVEIGGDQYIDAVYMTDGNLEEAIRRGADEIWAIWTVSRRGQWSHGFVNQYFQIIEIAANGRFFDTWNRIAVSNRAIAAGRPGEFGRHIEQKLLETEVPVHYLLNFSKDRMAESVNAGVLAARAWCQRNGVALGPGAPVAPPTPAAERSGVSFTEQMKGHVTDGETDPARGERAAARAPCMFELTIDVRDIDAFVQHPDHATGAAGFVDVPGLGGRRPVQQGTFQLFVDDPKPEDKRMLYRLWFQSAAGAPFTLSGQKHVHDDPGFDLWEDTTTLFVRILDGHVDAAGEAAAQVWGAGVLHIHTADLLRQLGTMRAHGPDIVERSRAMARFGRLFLGKLWDAYARRLLPFGPV
jgi:predicted acylesterase/phospholipase RssA